MTTKKGRREKSEQQTAIERRAKLTNWDSIEVRYERLMKFHFDQKN